MEFKKTHSILFILFLTGLGWGLSSCSTKRNTALARGYNNLTAHYNVYWNGEQNLEEAVAFLHNNVQDNYGKILRVYNYGNNAIGKQMASRVALTIKKAAMAIQNHSMVFGNKERIKWVTESYLMMGKAFFYKHDYTAARRVFDFVQKKYHFSPIHYRGTLWLAKTYIEMKQFGKAEADLNLLSSQLSDKDFPNGVRFTLPLVYADLYLAEKNPAAAYPYLEKSISTIHNKDLLSRVYFIMGQINKQEGDLELAGHYFKKVIKRNPPFQMDFEARLYLARCYQATSEGSKYIMKTLEKMARKKQYQDFRDQVYYAMAEIAGRNKNDSLMVRYLRLSVKYSKNNSYQKSMAALKLAEDYFHNGKYVPAEAYYDTAVLFLPKDYPQYAQIKNKSMVLSQLVQKLQTIHFQDSLQRLARMNTKQLYALIDKKINTYKNILAKKKKETRAKTENIAGQYPGNTTSGLPVSGPSPGGWYFYNPTALSRGFTQFRNQWGNRKLEDLWFLSDKNINMSNAGIAENQKTTASNRTSNKRQQVQPKPRGPETREFYLKGLPKTAKDFQRSDSLIVNSYNTLGFLYLEELNDTTDALKTYLELQKEYPDNQYRLQNWYRLYKIYNSLNDTGKALHYKNLILENYPGSLFAKVINNPDYYKKLLNKHLEAEQLYDRTYNAFEHGQYYRVILYANRAMKQFSGDTVTAPQFMYLRALSLGKVQIPDTLYSAMKQFIKKYPHHPLAARAKAIIQMLQLKYGIGITAARRAALLAAQKRKMSFGSYVFNKKAPQFVMLLSDRRMVNARALETRLSDFNQKYFPRHPVQITNLILNNRYNLLLIKQFYNAGNAMAYYNKLVHNPYVFSGISRHNYILFIISQENYPLFYKSKDVKVYQQFFSEYYQKQER